MSGGLEMSGERITSTYVLPEPYERAVELLRTALRDEGLKVTLEMDVSGAIRKELGVDLTSCRVFYVCCPLLLLHAVVVDSSAAALLPVRIVASDRGPQTCFRLLHPAGAGQDLSSALSVPAGRLWARVGAGLERIGARPAVGANWL